MNRHKTDALSVRHMSVVALLAGVFILLYAPTFRALYETWKTDEDYSHGFLIIPISLYLIWKKREELLSRPGHPSNWGFAILMLWAVMYFLGYVGEISTFVSYSMIVFLFGAVITLLGFGIAKAVAFPILFLIFMIPIPAEIYTTFTNPMKLMATTSSVWFLHLFNVPVLQEGNLMHLPNYSMKVVMACSGMRSLISVTALALLMGYLLLTSNARRLALFLLSIPVALLGNMLRITVTGMLAYFVSSEMAEGYSHTMAGLVTFVLSFILLFAGVSLVQWIAPERN